MYALNDVAFTRSIGSEYRNTFHSMSSCNRKQVPTQRLSLFSLYLGSLKVKCYFISERENVVQTK